MVGGPAHRVEGVMRRAKAAHALQSTLERLRHLSRQFRWHLILFNAVKNGGGKR